MGLFNWLGFGRKKTAPSEGVKERSDPPLGARPLFHIRYREDFGADTRRDIFPIRMYAMEEGVRAWDYLIGEIRLFKFSQMHGVHDNEAGCDIKVRGLWEWCGLPDTDQTFPDEEPGAMKQTEWQKNPEEPKFQVTVAVRGEPQQELLFTPSAWGSHARTMQGMEWPSKDIVWVNFAHIREAKDLKTGEILDRVGMWKLVLDRNDENPPWYVQWADQHLMVLCLVGFVRKEIGKFTAPMRPQIIAALQAVGYESLDDDGFKSIAQAVREGYAGCMSLSAQVSLLSSAERDACRTAAKALLESKGLEVTSADKAFPALI